MAITTEFMAATTVLFDSCHTYTHILFCMAVQLYFPENAYGINNVFNNRKFISELMI